MKVLTNRPLLSTISQEDIKSLCSHVVENFSKELEAIDYVQTFKALKLRYEQHQDKLKDRDRATLGLERYVCTRINIGTYQCCRCHPSFSFYSRGRVKLLINNILIE